MDKQERQDSKDRAFAVELSYERLFAKAVKNGEGSIMHNGASIVHHGARSQFNTGANAARHTYTAAKPLRRKIRWSQVQVREIEEICTMTFWLSSDNQKGRVTMDEVTLFEGSFTRASDYWCEMVSKF